MHTHTCTQFKCCGVESYLDYMNIYGYENHTVPVSCCDGSAKNVSSASGSKIDCDIAVQNVTQNKNKYIYSKVMVW